MSVNKVSQTDGSLAPIAGGTLYADEPIGTILPFGGSVIPNGFLLCNGAAVSRTTYAALFAVIGTSFGSGDGSTTFNIPDLRGEFLRGAGTNSHSGQGSGGSVGQHQDATMVTTPYITADNNYWTPQNTPSGASTVDNADARIVGSSVTLIKTAYTAAATDTNNKYSAVRPTNTSVNFIIKATSLALPTDFADAVDEKITANMIDSVTDGSQKAITSNAVFDQLKNFCMTVQASGSLTIEPNSQQGISLTYTCPQGYTPILAVPRSAGSWAWVWSYCYLQDTSHVYAVIRSVNSFQETQTISANVLCVRTYS